MVKLNGADSFLKTVGELIKRQRSLTMDQQDFAKRLGCGVNTVYRMENGHSVNSLTLFTALELLGLLEHFIPVLDDQYARVANAPQRKRRKTSEDFSNDF